MATNILEMSDDELLKLTDTQIEELVAAAPPVDHGGENNEQENNNDQEEEDDPANKQEPEQEQQEEDPPEADSNKEQESDPNEQEQGEPSTEQNKPEDEQDKPDVPEKESGTPAPAVPERDYAAEIAKILSPIKANGKTIQVESVDDAIQLIQMGANYHKKMEAVKPRLATLKLLEREGLLDQEKLSHLIDLAKGDPGAINKLIKDKNIDVLSLDGENAKDYKVSAYNVNPKEVELDNVLEDLRESTHYSTLLDTVGNKWDSASQQTIADNPEILRLLNKHMESGIFDKIQERMHTEGALGRLQGLSAIEAYRTIGDRLQAEGKFNSTPATTPPTKVAPVKPVTTKPIDDKAKERKLAASGTKGTTPSKAEPEYDPLSMSDEDFEKLYKTKFNTR